jgi:hypothetical protein
MAIPRPSSPRAAWADLKAFWQGQERHKLVFGLLAIMMPTLIMTGFYIDSRMDKPQAKIFYVQSFRSDRTDAEIRKQNIADQKALDTAREKRRQEYQRLADRLGIDTKN